MVPGLRLRSEGCRHCPLHAHARPGKMANTGWCWDGQGINGSWHLSIFGIGEGTKWFGLDKCCFMFYPNTALAMEKLHDMEEVACEISKWIFGKVEHPAFTVSPDGPEPYQRGGLARSRRAGGT